MKPDERVQRSAVVAGRQVRGTSDRERRRGQELLDRQAIAQLAEGGLEDPAGVGLLDELHQRLDVIGKPDGPVHDLSPFVPLRGRAAWILPRSRILRSNLVGRPRPQTANETAECNPRRFEFAPCGRPARLRPRSMAGAGQPLRPAAFKIRPAISCRALPRPGLPTAPARIPNRRRGQSRGTRSPQRASAHRRPRGSPLARLP